MTGKKRGRPPKPKSTEAAPDPPEPKPRKPGLIERPGRNGHGILRTWAPGMSGNPNGVPKSLKEVRQLCRQKGVAAAQALIRIIEDPNEDSRIVVVAAQTVLTWAYGKPPDYDPNEEKPRQLVDVSVLTLAEQKQMLGFLRRGLIKDVEPGPDEATAPVIEGEVQAS